MNGLIAFDIDAGHFAHQLRLDQDRAAIINLAHRCTEYLRAAVGRRLQAHEVPSAFLSVLGSARLPAERSFLLGIFTRPGPDTGMGNAATPRLVGALNFLCPAMRSGGTWCVFLLLLEPSVRGKGLGAAVHRAFAPWAQARGASRLGLTVLNNNPGALRFWRDRLGYQMGARLGHEAGMARPCRELFFSLRDAAPATPWQGGGQPEDCLAV